MSSENNILLLTPQCQDLWLLSPKQLMLYEKIQIDEQDLNMVLNPKRDTRFSAMKARSAEKLVKWGFLESVDYREFLPVEARAEIHRIATQTVDRYITDTGETIFDSRFFRLSVYTHERYAAYLEKIITACPFEDDSEIRIHIFRLKSIQKRLDQLQAGNIDDDLISALRWTLERITAKAVAGLYLSRKTGNSRLYDTDEYSPFIDDVLKSTPSEMTIFDPDENIPILSASVAALSKKALPDVGVADEYKLFSSLRDKSEFFALRKAIRTLENVFGELINERAELVRKKISVEVDRITSEVNERFDEVCNSFGESAKFVSIEMLAGQFAGFLGPWVNKAKESSAKEKLANLQAAFLERDDLAGNLFFMMEAWNRHKVLDDERFRKILKKKSEDTIWGEDKNDIPWYEDMPNKAFAADAKKPRVPEIRGHNTVFR